MPGNVVSLPVGALAGGGREEAYEQGLENKKNAETLENVGPKSIDLMSLTKLLK